MQVMLCQWWEEDLSIEFLWGAIKRCRIKDDTNVPDRLSRLNSIVANREWRRILLRTKFRVRYICSVISFFSLSSFVIFYKSIALKYSWMLDVVNARPISSAYRSKVYKLCILLKPSSPKEVTFWLFQPWKQLMKDTSIISIQN